MNWDTYECEGQMSIFDILQPGFRCWDEDINYIEKQLTAITKETGYENGKTDFRVWSHVPQYGFRLSHTIKIHKGNPKEREFLDRMDALVEEAKKRNVELSPMWGSLFWYGDDKTANLYCYSLFLDGRTKRKEE